MGPNHLVGTSLTLVTVLQARSEVLREPVEYGLRAALELQVAVPIAPSVDGSFFSATGMLPNIAWSSAG
jgi:hypothetical protein